jgi:hypothetical protein
VAKDELVGTGPSHMGTLMIVEVVVKGGRARSTDYPALLSEMLDGLLSKTEGNWEELSKELGEVPRAEIG